MGVAGCYKKTALQPAALLVRSGILGKSFASPTINLSRQGENYADMPV
jgi:hypothetical protein